MSDNQNTMSQSMGRIVAADVLAAIILFFVLLATVSVFAGLIALVISLGLLPVLLIWFVVHRIRKRRAGDAPAATTEEPQAPVVWVIIANVIAALALFFILWALLSVFAAVVALVIGLGVLPVAIIVYIVYRMRKKRMESAG